jgi:hypothetical protein
LISFRVFRNSSGVILFAAESTNSSMLSNSVSMADFGLVDDVAI